MSNIFLVDLDLISYTARLEIIKTTTNENLISFAISSESEGERGAVAQNLNISTKQLDYLSSDKSEYVRKCVLMNNKTLGKTIDNMLDNSEYTPNEMYIISHPNVLRRTLRRFINTHANKSAKAMAKKRLKSI